MSSVFSVVVERIFRGPDLAEELRWITAWLCGDAGWLRGRAGWLCGDAGWLRGDAGRLRGRAGWLRGRDR